MGERIKKLTRQQRRLRYVARRSTFWVCVAAAIALLVLADRLGVFGRAPAPDREKYDGKSFLVVHVVDGDTLDLDVPDGRENRTRVRLWGVDTPETVKENVPPQHYAPEASTFTKTETLDKIIRLELEPYRKTRDDYGRLLAFVYLADGRMLNRVLIKEGYAYADPRYNHHLASEFRRLQRQAKEAPRGLWKDVTNDDLPYYYRDKLKLGKK